MTRLLYDAEGAAELLSTTKTRVHELRKSGALPARQDGRQYKFSRDDLQAYIDGLPTFEPGVHA